MPLGFARLCRDCRGFLCRSSCDGLGDFLCHSYCDCLCRHGRGSHGSRSYRPYAGHRHSVVAWLVDLDTVFCDRCWRLFCNRCCCRHFPGRKVHQAECEDVDQESDSPLATLGFGLSFGFAKSVVQTGLQNRNPSLFELFLLRGVSPLLRLVHFVRTGAFVSQFGFEELFERLEVILGPHHGKNHDVVLGKGKRKDLVLVVEKRMSLLL